MLFVYHGRGGGSSIVHDVIDVITARSVLESPATWVAAESGVIVVTLICHVQVRNTEWSRENHRCQLRPVLLFPSCSWPFWELL